MTELVVVSLEAWDAVWRRNQHLVAGLLRADQSLRVLFAEPAADPLHEVRTGRAPRPGRGLVAVDDLAGVGPGRLWRWQPTKWLPRRIDPGADHRRSRALVRAVDRLRWSAPVLWINDPGGSSLLRLTSWPALYDITDDWLLADRGPREHARLAREEALLLHDCAEVVVCSAELASTKGTVRPVTLVPNAVDLAAYLGDPPRPGDLPPGPVALYAGTIHRDRMDLALTARTAAALGGIGTLVCVGPVALDAADAAALGEAGVVLLGPRPAPDVPAYLRHADVLVVPHVRTPFTDSLDPIKRYEYQAAGRPVVATPVAGFADAGLPRTRVVPAQGFPEVVVAALAAARLGAPLPAVDRGVPTWDLRVRRTREVIDRVASSGLRRAR